MTRKPGKKQMENPVGCTGEGNRWKWIIREWSREGKTRTVLLQLCRFDFPPQGGFNSVYFFSDSIISVNFHLWILGIQFFISKKIYLTIPLIVSYNSSYSISQFLVYSSYLYFPICKRLQDACVHCVWLIQSNYFPHAEKTSIQFPVKLNGIWSWWPEIEYSFCQCRIAWYCQRNQLLLPVNLKDNIIVFAIYRWLNETPFGSI